MTLASLTQMCTYTRICAPQGTGLPQKGKCTLLYLQNVFPSLMHEHFPGIRRGTALVLCKQGSYHCHDPVEVFTGSLQMLRFQKVLPVLF